jgi:hypothetical protein
MVERTDEVLATTEFLTDSSQEQILLLVQQESLNIRSEARLIEACLKWADHEAIRQGLNNETEVLRTILGPVFECLRFLALTTKEFKAIIENSNALTDKEKCSILFILSTKDFTKIPNGISQSISSHFCTFSAKPAFAFSNSFSYNPATTIDFHPSNIPYVNCLDFKVDTDVYMLGFMAAQKPITNSNTFSFGAIGFFDSTPVNFNSVFLKGPAGIVDTGSITNVGRISHINANHHKHSFEKKVLLRKNEVYSITLISHKGQFVSQILPAPIVGTNLYTEESMAPNNLISTLSGILYKKA